MAEKILIVDDDVETLRLVGLMLQRQGYEILAADNGKQALSLAKSECPDLIVLDVMMPDMDGYQVTHALRAMPETALAPILMFTAKSQVDDKVAGYEAGVDDYLTKPVHPAELVAHIKALLARTRARPAQEQPAQKSYMIGVMACRGGLGVSTLTLNLATSYARANKGTPVIAVELRPGQGTWGFELGFNNPDGLSSLLKRKPGEIDSTLVKNSLITTPFGVKLLMAPIFSSDLDFSTLSDYLIAITNVLSKMNAVIFLDIGTSFLPGFQKICRFLNNILILVEPQLTTVKRTKIMVEQLESANLSSGKSIDLILYNRVRADTQMNTIQVTEEMEGMPVATMVPPAPELANQAAQTHKPMIDIQPDGLVAQQFSRMAEIVQERISQNQ
jgi:CheY-like chemotaxis protein/MinD-like ATPase involved in chromosome partitioning or flagellar assembly